MSCGALWMVIRLVGNSCLPVALRLAIVQRPTPVQGVLAGYVCVR